MKRAPIVLTGTACGLVAVIGYHAATPQASALTATSSAGTANVATTAKSSTTATTAKSSTTGKSSTTATTASAAKTTTSSAAATRSAVGSDVQYQYGDLEVKVTMTGSRITDVSLAKIDVYDPRSESIDQYAVPQLRSQALSVQSASIDGVSGASYTSAAYQQSLQSAIDKLKV